MFRLRALQVVAAIALVAAASRAQSPALRFHHLHVRVADPTTAMAKYVRANGCISVVVQGVGVGIRCGRSYLLFDRNDRPADGTVAKASIKVSGSGERATITARVSTGDPNGARTWIRERLGIDPAPAITFAGKSDERSMPDEITHIAFASADPGPIVASLKASTSIISLSEDATVVSGPGGLPIEIVRDAGLDPDAYWCPMHPDVRSPAPGTCPRCNMTLVPIPPPAFGDYRMHVDSSPLGQGRDRLTIRLTNPSAPDRAPTLLTVHDRLLHLFIVSRDLQWFQHLHPEETADGAFGLDVTWPAVGIYGVFADFYPAGGTPQLLQTTVVTADYRGLSFPRPAALQADSDQRRTDGSVSVTLSSPRLVAGREQTLTFTLADAASGAPITDLEPYLGAPGHLFVTSADLVDATHSHPLNSRSTGPDVKFDVTFPRPGLHKMWAQFQRRGVVVTVAFVVAVE